MAGGLKVASLATPPRKRPRVSLPRTSDDEYAGEQLPQDDRHAKPVPRTPQSKPAFARDASIVLVGLRGSGLSSLAVIASRILHYRFFDAEVWVASHHMPKGDFIRQHGVEAYRNAMADALEQILARHSQGAVILCGPEALIMVNRDLATVQEYLGLSSQGKAIDVLRRSQDVYRRLSTFEFHNLEEHTPDNAFATELAAEHSTRKSTVLQNVSQDFSTFLRLLGLPIDEQPQRLLYPSSPEKREFSSALRLWMGDVLSAPSKLYEIDCDSDAVELVIPVGSHPLHKPADRDHIALCLQLLRRVFMLPIIYHIECDNQWLETNRSTYSDMVRWGLRMVPEYITINLGLRDVEISALMAGSHGSTKVIGHRTLPSISTSSWSNARPEFDRAVSLGCDVIRLVNKTSSPFEDRACMHFQAQTQFRSETPLVAINLGSPAQCSAVLNHALTPVSHTQRHGPENDREQLLTTPQLMAARFSSFAYQPLHFHIFGASTSRSLSPILHNAAFKHLGMSHRYSIEGSNDLGAFKDLVNDTFGGASISLPFKSDILCLLDSVSEAAKAIQAVNTILPVRSAKLAGSTQSGDSPTALLDKDQKHRAGPVKGLHGENTDWIALYACILRRLSPANAVSDTSSALVIGAGGMARAAIYALFRLGVRNIMVWNRTPAGAVRIAEHFNNIGSQSPGRRGTPLSSAAGVEMNTAASRRVRTLDTIDTSWPADLAPPTLIISTIPKHSVDSTVSSANFSLPSQWLSSPTGGVIVEVSYDISWTELLQQATEHADEGWVAVKPMEVLIEQGCAQFELFTGCPAPRRTITKAVLQGYRTVHDDVQAQWSGHAPE